MDAKEIHNKIQEISNVPGLNEKKKLLSEVKEDNLFRKYLQYTYDEINYTFGKNKLPGIKTGTENTDPNLELFFDLLDNLAAGNLRGKKGDEALQDYLNKKDPIYYDLMFWVLTRDVKAKIGAKLINDAFQ